MIVMEPFSPQDPLHELLGRAKQVEPRPNFTQNVLRTVRNLPRRESAWERLTGWLGGVGFPRLAVAGGLAAVAIAGVVFLSAPREAADTRGIVSTVVQTKPVQAKPAPVKASALTQAVALDHAEEIDFAQELDSMNQLTKVLAQQDTGTLSDADLALLLY